MVVVFFFRNVGKLTAYTASRPRRLIVVVTVVGTSSLHSIWQVKIRREFQLEEMTLSNSFYHFSDLCSHVYSPTAQLESLEI